MLRPADTVYKLTRLIKLKQLNIEEEFCLLVQWINENYQVEVLNIYKDILNETTTRLQIIFDSRNDANKFSVKQKFHFSIRKQRAIAKKYFEFFGQGKLNTTILVLFYAFEPVAREAANDQVSLKMITKLKEKYESQFWEIKKYGEHTTFFFYTDKQLAAARDNQLLIKIKREYFELLKRFDEFNYFTLNNFNAVFDTKQNFDTKYNGNWRSYYD